jgi:phosphatidylinositol glycan class B
MLLYHLISEEKGVLDESDRFMMDPVSFMSKYAKDSSHHSHIVLFDSEEKKLRSFLISFDYREVICKTCPKLIFALNTCNLYTFFSNLKFQLQEKRFFNAHFKVDRDLQASIVVYVRTR